MCSFEDHDELFSFSRGHLAWSACAVALMGLAAYRREMSSNRVFHVVISPATKKTKGPVDDDDDDDVDKPSLELLLEGAGLYCSGDPLRSLVLEAVGSLLRNSVVAMGSLLRNSAVGYLDDRKKRRKRRAAPTMTIADGRDPMLLTLSLDVHTHVASFLTSKDVVHLGGACRALRSLTGSPILWKHLWRRDYGWIVEQWHVGKAAGGRSSTAAVPHGRDFYFRFRRSYLNYVLAGHNTTDSCLIGLHGDVYDITDFLDRHPGSPETLLVEAGRDATAFFEDMNHSHTARKMAGGLCVVVEDDGGGGAHPPTARARRPTCRRKPPPPMLRTVEDALVREEAAFRRSLPTPPDKLGPVNCYHDPFRGEWRAWYTNRNFETVFL